MLTSDRARIQQLTQQGLRKPKFLRLYVTYTVQSDSEGAQDLIEKLIGRGETLWKSFTGELQQAKNQRLQTVITKAFTDGFLLWEQVLSNKMGLSVKLKSCTSLKFVSRCDRSPSNRDFNAQVCQ